MVGAIEGESDGDRVGDSVSRGIVGVSVSIVGLYDVIIILANENQALLRRRINSAKELT
jgi:hypothetical protein